jgi:hypothetical protein
MSLVVRAFAPQPKIQGHATLDQPAIGSNDEQPGQVSVEDHRFAQAREGECTFPRSCQQSLLQRYAKGFRRRVLHAAT